MLCSNYYVTEILHEVAKHAMMSGDRHAQQECLNNTRDILDIGQRDVCQIRASVIAPWRGETCCSIERCIHIDSENLCDAAK